MDSRSSDTLLKILFLGVICCVHSLKRHQLLESYLETNEVQTQSCDRVMQHVYNDHVIATNPPDLVGEWTSGRCEVRPGGEFLLRRYTFFEVKHQFELHQYYYSDSDCTTPAYSIVAKGRLFVGEPSWLVPGALDSEYSLTLVSVMPYTTDAASHLAVRLNNTCPGIVGVMERHMEPSKAYNIYHFVVEDDLDESSDVLVDKDCMSALDLAFHELQLMRLEVRKKKLEIRRSLYLGDIHTDRKERAHYKPTSYQEPLYFEETSGCHTCDKIKASSRKQPPVLNRKLPSHEKLAGEWFSTRCEVRPVGQFVTRHLVFSPSGDWQGYYHHFSDQRCHLPMFTVFVRGSYGAREKSGMINNANYYRIKIDSMKITAKDERIVNLLNEDMGDDVCAKKGSWKLGETQDVTSTNGCAMLSLQLPINEKELMKLEKIHHHTLLYVGQLPSTSLDNQSRYLEPSTSFQSPLIKCGSSKGILPKQAHTIIDINSMALVGGQNHAASAIPSLVSVLTAVSLMAFL